MATSAIDMANSASGGSNENSAMLDGPGTLGGGYEEAVPAPTYGGGARGEFIKIGIRPPIKIDGATASRVVRVDLTGAPYEEVIAANDPDTGVISVRIGCQMHPIARWRRVGAKLIERQWGASEVARLAAPLSDVLDRIEAEFAKA